MTMMEAFELFSLLAQDASGAEKIFNLVANLVYFALAAIALWGAFCVVMVWMRVGKKRFRNEEQQDEFLEAMREPLMKGDFDAAVQLCDGDSRAMPQLAHMAIENRGIGYNKVRLLMIDRFQRDVLSDLEHWLSWGNTVIKSAPMVGLFGGVQGLMGAFEQLATADTVEPAAMAKNISVALVTTACGLAIAIPLILAVASVGIRIRKMEDLVGAGLTHFLDIFKEAMGRQK